MYCDTTFDQNSTISSSSFLFSDVADHVSCVTEHGTVVNTPVNYEQYNPVAAIKVPTYTFKFIFRLEIEVL
jgi:hypothetical protein